MITTREQLAAEIAAGQALAVHDIKVALQKWAETPLADMREVLIVAIDTVGMTGGNKALIDEIKMLRIVIAVREIREHG